MVGGSNPGGGRIYRTCPDRPWAHPTSYTMGTGSFPGVKRPGRGVGHPLPSSAEVKERVELYLYSTSGPLWPVIGEIYLLPLLSLFLLECPIHPHQERKELCFYK